MCNVSVMCNSIFSVICKAGSPSRLTKNRLLCWNCKVWGVSYQLVWSVAPHSQALTSADSSLVILWLYCDRYLLFSIFSSFLQPHYLLVPPSCNLRYPSETSRLLVLLTTTNLNSCQLGYYQPKTWMFSKLNSVLGEVTQWYVKCSAWIGCDFILDPPEVNIIPFLQMLVDSWYLEDIGATLEREILPSSTIDLNYKSIRWWTRWNNYFKTIPDRLKYSI